MPVGMARGLGLENRPIIALSGLPGRVMKGRTRSAFLGAAATAALSFFPICANAQDAEIPWRSLSPRWMESVSNPFYVLPGEPLVASFSNTPAPVRLIDSFEDSDADWEHRREILASIAFLGEVRCRTALDVVTGLPNGMMDWITGAVRSSPERGEVLSMKYLESRSLLPRLFAWPVDDASTHTFDDLVGHILFREHKYFARIQGSAISDLGVEEGLEDIDTGDVMRAQNKILLASCRRLYFDRYGGRFDDRFRDRAFDISCWHPVDFVVAPALVTGFAYMFGWETRIDLLGLRSAIQVEPLRRILERHDSSSGDLVSAASMHIGVGKFPLRVIISVGIMDGDALVDFVGIGTSLGEARQVIARELAYLRGDE